MVALFYPSNQLSSSESPSYLPNTDWFSQRRANSYATVKCNRGYPHAKIFVKGTGSKVIQWYRLHSSEWSTNHEDLYTAQTCTQWEHFLGCTGMLSIDSHDLPLLLWLTGHWACSHSHHLPAVLPVQHHAHHSYPVPSPEQKQHNVHTCSEQVCKEMDLLLSSALSCQGSALLSHCSHTFFYTRFLCRTFYFILFLC